MAVMTGSSWVGSQRTNIHDAVKDLEGKLNAIDVGAGSGVFVADIDGNPLARNWRAYIVYSTS